MKRVRELLPALTAHAQASGVADATQAASLTGALDQLKADVDWLADAEDADDREDAHAGLICSLEEVGELLSARAG